MFSLEGSYFGSSKNGQCAGSETCKLKEKTGSSVWDKSVGKGLRTSVI